jgi:hypothetical protein
VTASRATGSRITLCSQRRYLWRGEIWPRITKSIFHFPRSNITQIIITLVQGIGREMAEDWPWCLSANRAKNAGG